MRKPIGRNASIHVAFDPQGGVRGEFQRVQWPESKPEIERQVAEGFVATMANAAIAGGLAPMFTGLECNAEDDFDFTAQGPNGRAYLELLELAPLTGPYEAAKGTYKPYDLAVGLYSKIMDKSRRYPGPRKCSTAHRQ